CPSRRPPCSTPFPTRRSSDLPVTVHYKLFFVLTFGHEEYKLPLGEGDDRIGHPLIPNFQSILIHVRIVYDTNPITNLHHHYPPRSEEHTSELQSRENLVCRLL